MARLTVAWKVAAFLPLVLTGAVLAGRIDLGTDDPATEPSANSALFDDRTPAALAEDDVIVKRDKGDKKDDASESPTAEETTASPTDEPTSESPTPDDPDPTTPSQSPTKSPTKNPSPSPSPTDTPTPDEAREACEEAGVNPLDLPAMAACIAEILGGG